MPKTFVSTPELRRALKEDPKYQGKITQRSLVVRALVVSAKPKTLDDLLEALDGPIYKATVKHKTRTGEPDPHSWFVLEADGIRGSIKYHLNRLKKENLIHVRED